MTYRIEFSGRARADLRRLVEWLDERSSEAANRLTDQFETALTRLETNPFTCGLAFENGSTEEEIRHLLFGIGKGPKYRALFTIRADEIILLAIRGPGERPVAPPDLDDLP